MIMVITRAVHNHFGCALAEVVSNLILLQSPQMLSPHRHIVAFDIASITAAAVDTSIAFSAVSCR